jgi:hypothetical protein
MCEMYFVAEITGQVDWQEISLYNDTDSDEIFADGFGFMPIRELFVIENRNIVEGEGGAFQYEVQRQLDKRFLEEDVIEEYEALGNWLKELLPLSTTTFNQDRG